MAIDYIRHFHFRNLVDGRVDFNGASAVFTGENAQGKTNILESIYFLCYGSSFRSRNESKLIRFGEKDLSVSGSLTGNPDEDQIFISVSLNNNRKSIKKNHKIIRDRKDIIRTLPCILFGHGDTVFITGPQEKRRWFFDQTISLYSNDYIQLYRTYKKLLKNRNSLLKEKKMDLLEVYTAQIATVGYQIQQERNKTLTHFSQMFSELYSRYSGFSEDLLLNYRPSWKEVSSSDDIQSILMKNMDKDLRMGTTTTGVHRDRFLFSMNGEDCGDICSTGQIRLLSLFLRMGQTHFFHRVSGRKPLLLLDDVFLELDKKRRETILNNLPMAEQLFFTFLPGDFHQFRDREVFNFHVERGEIKKIG